MTTLIDRPAEAPETLSDEQFEHDLDVILRSAHRAQETRDENAAEGVRARTIQRRRLIRVIVAFVLIVGAVTAAVIGMVRHAEAVAEQEEMEARVAAYTAAVEAEQEWLNEQAAIVNAERAAQVRAELAARWETATETITALIADGQTALDESDGKVDDNTPRENLSAALAALTAARDGDSLLDAEDAAETDLSDLIGAVEAAVQEREDRIAEEARIAAEREAARIAAQQSTSTPQSQSQSTSNSNSNSGGSQQSSGRNATVAAAEAAAARWGVRVSWVGTTGCGHSGGVSASEYVTIAGCSFGNGTIQLSVGGANLSTLPTTPGVIAAARNVATHESAHELIARHCGTVFPAIAGARYENVTDAYAAIYMGAGSASGGYGYTSADAEIARLIHGGQCS